MFCRKLIDLMSNAPPIVQLVSINVSTLKFVTMIYQGIGKMRNCGMRNAERTVGEKVVYVTCQFRMKLTEMNV